MRSLIRYFFISFTLLFSISSHAWWDCLWAYRSQATITNQAGQALSNYNVTISLTATSLNPDYDWNNNGADIRVISAVDDTTALPYFIENWNTANKTANIYVPLDFPNNNTSHTVYIYHGNSSASTTASILSFEEEGIKFHTRYRNYGSSNPSAGPGSYNQAIADFNASNDNNNNYGCAIIDNFAGVRNRLFGNQSSNYIAYSESYFKVENNEAGVWEFRYGSDFTFGGELRVDGVTVDSKWDQDLWWGYNWNNSSEILRGTITLTPGYHRLEIIGAEYCCDGDLTVQYNRPTESVFRTFTSVATSPNYIDIKSRTCPVNEPLVGVSIQPSNLPSLNLTSNVELINDIIASTSVDRALSGSTVEYTYQVTNTANASVSEDSLFLDIPIPANTKLLVNSASFTDGTGTSESGLSFTYTAHDSTTDDVEFSTDGSDYSYEPVIDGQGADANITHVRIHFKGRLNCAAAPTPTPTFSSKLDLIIE